MGTPGKRRAARVVVLVIIVVCVSRSDVLDIAYKLMIVILHGAWECLEDPAPDLSPSRLVKLCKDSIFELAKK